jgi:protein-glutamine gamma-glutamyltransferase
VKPLWQDLSSVLIGLVVTASLAGAAWQWRERQRQDPWLRLLHQAGKRLRTQGLAVPEGSTPRAMARLLQNDARASPQAIDWLLRLEAWRYAQPTQRPASLRQLRQALGVLWLRP